MGAGARAATRALGPDARLRWDLRFVSIADNNDPAVPQYIGQVADGAPWDLVMVDGWSRLKCLLEGIQYVKPGGVLVLDNANQKQFDSVPGVMRQWERHKFRGLGVARSWVTQTDRTCVLSAMPRPSARWQERT